MTTLIVSFKVIFEIALAGALIYPAMAEAQIFCALLPLCPEDGAIPRSSALTGTWPCFCPAPASCPFPNTYNCDLLGTETEDWSCECSRPEPVPYDPPVNFPLPPPNGFCGGIVCPDGSAPFEDGLHCLCHIFFESDSVHKP